LLKRILYALARIVVLFYAVAGLALYFFQEKLIFHPRVLPADFKFDVGLPSEELSIGAEHADALLVHAENPRGLLLHFHGNGGNLEGWSEVAEELARKLHWDVLVLDYPGFGKSPGEIRSEAQLWQLSDDAFSLAEQRARAAKLPVAVMGRSLGTGLAVRIAALHPVTALVLEAPYYSLKKMAQLQYPWAPLFLLRYPLDSAGWMPRVAAPTLVFHGDADELIPHSQGEALAALNPSARFVTFPGGTHDGLRHFPLYWQEIERFFDGLKLEPHRVAAH
jgi:pimeloyl-ACP methyl ester carboxylesterase